MDFIEIPYENLSHEALLGVVKDYIAREGTDYGEIEISFEDKVAEVMQQVRGGAAKIFFDRESQSVTLLASHQIVPVLQ